MVAVLGKSMTANDEFCYHSMSVIIKIHPIQVGVHLLSTPFQNSLPVYASRAITLV
jgi:hypothetical protein